MFSCKYPCHNGEKHERQTHPEIVTVIERLATAAAILAYGLYNSIGLIVFYFTGPVYGL